MIWKGPVPWDRPLRSLLAAARYRLRFTNSCSISSLVVITLLFA